MRAASLPNRDSGVTLIELVVAITVLAIAVSSILGLLSAQATNSALALIRQQAVAIASSYLNEVLAKSYGIPSGNTPRINYTTVADYSGLADSGAHDQTGSAIAGLAQFNVGVNVVAGPAAALGTVPAAQVMRVDVTVSHPSGVTVRLSGYRTKYHEPTIP